MLKCVPEQNLVSVEIDCYQREIEGRSTVGNFNWGQIGSMLESKPFTNLVKTIANSTTYCRKPGDCNGTIIFEVDIMKNSSPLNLKFTIFAMSKPK